MGRIGCILMAVGFLAAWLMPVVGAFVMVVGGIVTAIASEQSMAVLPDIIEPRRHLVGRQGIEP